MKKLLFVSVCAVAATIFTSCGNEPEILELSPQEARLVGEWKAVGEDIRASKDDRPVEVEIPDLDNIVDWHYEFKSSGRGSGSEHYLTGGDETIGYHFLWNLTSDRIRFANMEYDDPEESVGSRLPFGFMHRDYEVEEITSGTLVLSCEDIWQSDGAEYRMVTTYFFEKVE